MDSNTDTDKTSDRTKRQIELAKTGRYRKWKAAVKKANNKKSTKDGETRYSHPYTAKTHQRSVTAHSNKTYHIRLSEYDEKHPCNLCGEDSTYYCNMNDQYFCTIHLVGHDKNEF